MLTRDIALDEAILDLLDNCVDGILRTDAAEAIRPYDGYRAAITFDADSFAIEDNCGGIPPTLLDYAFRLGRAPDYPEDEKPRGAVGVYGIGMKRAIFKMGESCVISTQHENASYEVSISREWLHDEDDWNIPFLNTERSKHEDGTKIMVTNLYDGITAAFGNQREALESELAEMVSTHYSFIIDKGFSVTINGAPISSRSRGFVYTPNTASNARVIRPFTYETTTDDGVDVFMAVGFDRAIPSEDDVSSEQEETSRSSENAGWTVVCNDRAVLFCDRSELTGWGETGVPRFHNQFIAVSGMVEFRCEDPAKLPTTTTKRGVDASSLLYLQTKNKMREGMALFTAYTNRWKSRPTEVREQFASGETATFSDLKEGIMGVSTSPSTIPFRNAQQYKPNLPAPQREDPQTRRISFTKNAEDVRIVAEYLSGDSERNPSDVGQECFDLVLQEANS
ncbi:hypothetical protein GBAR_LOCUS2033 [Geodia barretti]|uniref:ATP-binding protein n=1 Tax=Geodia barretti TaxID=519541 RepID=A0AA35QYE3_GEOBA|nr:hypothetical protein GBAR_LOCUS2033 [Geodia barretti]